jgi:hypothetical protein
VHGVDDRNGTDSDDRTERMVTEEELQEHSGEDLSFHGWRDWLLVFVGVPIFVAALVSGARAGIGQKGGGGPFPVPWTIAVVVVITALVCGLLWRKRP